jgi:hypothetical protein
MIERKLQIDIPRFKIGTMHSQVQNWNQAFLKWKDKFLVKPKKKKK